MASGWDKISNGVIFGAIFGILALYASLNISTISFVSDLIGKLATWLTSQSWMSWYTFGYLNYVCAALIGAIIGGYIDAQ